MEDGIFNTPEAHRALEEWRAETARRADHPRNVRIDTARGADPMGGEGFPPYPGEDGEQAGGPIKISPTPFRLRDPAQIPPREWLYGKHLIRGFVSLTVSPGGLGKSSMLQVESLSMASGRALLGEAPPRPLRVWVWNGEDPTEELERRMTAAAMHYGIKDAEIGDRLLVDSGRVLPITLATSAATGFQIARPTVEALVEAIRTAQIDVLVIDPFVTSHQVPENDTGAMNAVVAEWRAIADRTGCAIELVHHVNKAGAMAGDDFGIYAARGAGALIDGVRSARYLVRMKQEEADRFGIDPTETHLHFRVENGAKANLAPPGKATWRRMIGVSLGNGRDLWPDGDNVGVCTEWTPPDAFEGMTARDLQSVQKAIDAAEEPPKDNERAGDWVGLIVGDVLGLDLGPGLKKQERNPAQNMARAKVRQLLSGWKKSGALVAEEIHSARDGRKVAVVRVGDPVTAADIAGEKVK